MCLSFSFSYISSFPIRFLKYFRVCYEIIIEEILEVLQTNIFYLICSNWFLFNICPYHFICDLNEKSTLTTTEHLVWKLRTYRYCVTKHIQKPFMLPPRIPVFGYMWAFLHMWFGKHMPHWAMKCLLTIICYPLRCQQAFTKHGRSILLGEQA